MFLCVYYAQESLQTFVAITAVVELSVKHPLNIILAQILAENQYKQFFFLSL